jgi:capsular polysaccharide biosynthesis protein
MVAETSIFERIQAHVSAGEWTAADELCGELIAADEGNAGLWHMRGGIAAHGKDWTAAEIYYRKAIALAPQTGQPWLGLAKIYVAIEDLFLAAPAAAEALARGLPPDDEVSACDIVAHGMFQRGEIAEGRAVLAALVPYYRERCAPDTREAVLAAFPGLSAAMCAGDTALATTLLRKIYPHASTIGPVAITETVSLREWCQTNGARYEVLEQPRDIVLPATSPHGREIAYRSDPIAIAAIPGGCWVPRFDYASTPDGKLLHDSGYMHLDATFNFLPHAYLRPANLVVHHAPTEKVYIDDDVLLLSSPPDNNFGHWMIDFLRRLLARDHVAAKLKLAIPEPLRAKQSATLELCGVDPADILLCRHDATYKFRTLYVYQGGHAMPPHPTHVAYLRKCFWGDRAGKPTRGKRFYLSRASVGTRMVANVEEFNRTLADLGFQSVELADHSIAAQREMFADAEILLGGMGTNLLALYFAPPGCTVIGIIDDPVLDTLVAQTCAILGMSCQYLISKPAGTSRKAMHDRDLDFVADGEELKRRVRELG